MNPGGRVCFCFYAQTATRRRRARATGSARRRPAPASATATPTATTRPPPTADSACRADTGRNASVRALHLGCHPFAHSIARLCFSVAQLAPEEQSRRAAGAVPATKASEARDSALGALLRSPRSVVLSTATPDAALSASVCLTMVNVFRDFGSNLGYAGSSCQYSGELPSTILPCLRAVLSSCLSAMSADASTCNGRGKAQADGSCTWYFLVSVELLGSTLWIVDWFDIAPALCSNPGYSGATCTGCAADYFGPVSSLSPSSS